MRLTALLAFPGGLALFVLGMRQASEGLRRLAGDQMRRVIGKLTRHRVMGLLVGIVATMVFQSSTATTVLLVGFARAELMSLRQAMGILLGADIGTTITVQLISFHVPDYALAMIALGVVPSLVKTRPAVRSVGEVVLGFGFVFYSMKLMVDSASEMLSSPSFVMLLRAVSDSPWIGFTIGAIMTALLASSAATLGILLALAKAGAMTLGGALPMVLGANIGTASTAIWAASGGGATAKRVAAAHLLFKLAGVLLVWPLLGPFTWLVERLADTPARQIADAHTIFNVGMGLLFLPLTDLGAWLLYRVYRVAAEEKPFGPKFLDPRARTEPALAFAAAKQEILRMAEIVVHMLRTTLDPFIEKDAAAIDRLETEDDKVDLLNREIKFYLAKTSQAEITPALAGLELHLIVVVTQLELIGDVINKNIMELADKFLRKRLVFSIEGIQEIRDLHAKVVENLEIAVHALRREDAEAARKVLRHEAKIVALEKDLVQSHLRRLHAGLPETYDTSSIHLELLASLRWINHHSKQMVDWVAEPQERAS